MAVSKKAELKFWEARVFRYTPADMNALFYDIHGKEIRDYNVDEQGKGKGFADIRNKTTSMVGNAQDRFREDKLRIPRLVRFFSKYNS